jgi:hypothetical protein
MTYCRVERIENNKKVYVRYANKHLQKIER